MLREAALIALSMAIVAIAVATIDHLTRPDLAALSAIEGFKEEQR